MTALDDFIAQDPSSRDFVNVLPGSPNSDIRWTEMQVRDRTEAILEGSGYTQAEQRILARKIDLWELEKIEDIRQQLGLQPDPILQAPPYPLSDAEKMHLAAYGQTALLCGALKDVMWGRAQLLATALDYEAVRDWLATLPPVEEGQPDLSADLRAALQAQLDAAAPGTLDLVARRDAWRAEQAQGIASATDADVAGV